MLVLGHCCFSVECMPTWDRIVIPGAHSWIQYTVGCHHVVNVSSTALTYVSALGYSHRLAGYPDPMFLGVA